MHRINTLLEQHRRWLSRGRQMVDRELEYLDEDLADRSLSTFASISDSLDMLATYFGIQGEVGVMDGNDSGWTQISQSIMYRYWALMLKARSVMGLQFLGGIQGSSKLNNKMRNAGCLLAVFLAEDRRDLASSVASLLKLMVENGSVVSPSYSGGHQFERFMLWLHRVHLSGQYVADSSDFGVYGKILDGWQGGHALHEAIENICDYHLNNIVDDGVGRNPEFKNSPFDLLPQEVMSIIRVRRHLDLSTPEVRHPLLSTRAARIGRLHFESDNVVARVESLYCELSTAG